MNLSLSFSLSIFLSLSLSIYIYIYIYIYLVIYLSFSISLYISLFLSLFLSLYFSLSFSLSLSLADGAITWILPVSTAMCRAVYPSLVATFTSAPIYSCEMVRADDRAIYRCVMVTDARAIYRLGGVYSYNTHSGIHYHSFN